MALDGHSGKEWAIFNLVSKAVISAGQRCRPGISAGHFRHHYYNYTHNYVHTCTGIPKTRFFRFSPGYFVFFPGYFVFFPGLMINFCRTRLLALSKMRVTCCLLFVLHGLNALLIVMLSVYTCTHITSYYL